MTMSLRIFFTFCVVSSIGFTGVSAQDTPDQQYQYFSDLLDSAKLYVNDLNHEEGAKWLETCTDHYSEGMPRVVRGKYHLIRAEWLLNTWQLRDAETEFGKAIALWSSVGDSVQLAYGYSGLGTTLSAQKRYQDAIRYQIRAIDFFGVRDSSEHYSLVSNLAVSYNNAQDFGRALQHHIEVKEFFAQNGIKGKQAVVEGNIGELYRGGLKNFPRAVEHFHKAIWLNREVDQPNYLVQNYHNLGMAYLDMHSYDSAYYYIRESVDLRKKLNSRGGLAISIHGLGSYFLQTNQPDSALWAFGETIRISEENGIAPGIFYGSCGVGEVQESLGNFDKAHAAFKKAVKMADEIGSLELQEKARALLYNLYKTHNHSADALSQYEKLITIRDSVRNFQNRENLIEVKTRYETNLSEAENVALKASQQAQKMEIERQQWLVLGLSVVLLLVILATVILIWANRQRKLAYRKAVATSKELARQYETVKEQELKLTEANALKDRIFSVLGHDLRSPLANISYMLPLISAEEFRAEELTTILDHLKRDTDLSINTLHNILQWSQLQSTEVSVHHKSLEVSAVFKELRQVFESTARLKNVDLEFSGDPTTTLWVDENQFRSIATNLISNAIKFTPSGEKVEVKVSEVTKGIAFSVTDRGRGFNAEVLEKLNQRNTPLSVEGTQGEKGTGIGLQIVKDFVAAHNGEFTISSNEYGGALVTVVFPKNQDLKNQVLQKKSA